MRVIFLDFDGVIRIPPDGEWIQQPPSEFCQSRMKLLATVCRQADAQIVISSDWRHMESVDTNTDNLLPYLARFMHADWATPITGHRWNEVARWLTQHPEVTHYAILEDFEPHFDGCPPAMRGRIVWCNNRHGLLPKHAGRIIELLNRN